MKAKEIAVARKERELQLGGKIHRDDGRGGLDSCSCIYGQPCLDEFGCRDWSNRFTIAEQNGWQGFSKQEED